MAAVIIHHIPGSGPPRFRLIAEDTPGEAPPVAVPAAEGFPVPGRPRSDLLQELLWYLERFLEYPISPETDHAERVLTALRNWGETVFRDLFIRPGSPVREVTEGFPLEIRSDDPRILSWPWEALRDQHGRPLGQVAEIERRLAMVLPPAVARPEHHAGPLRILLITARPADDIDYRLVSGPLIELAQELPVRVHVLRPPTLSRLAEHLGGHRYDVVHFDGHGIFEMGSRSRGEGQLVFEDDEGGALNVPATIFSRVLQRSVPPLVVLNACRSATLDKDSGDAFASVATSLLCTGVGHVVAMAYALNIRAAREFFPAFYRHLVKSGRVSGAVRAGRLQMSASPERFSVRGYFALEDWIVPVVYRRGDAEHSISVGIKAASERPIQPSPADEKEIILGRDGEILDLERRLRQEPAGILIHGLHGVGKTTLAWDLVVWLRNTEGLGDGVVTMSLSELESARDLFSQLGQLLIGADFASSDLEREIQRLVDFLRPRRYLLIWDDFETVCGALQTGFEPRFAAEDRQRILSFLRALRGAGTKVLILSTRRETWLADASSECGAVVGLREEARWAVCEKLLAEHGLESKRGDEDLDELVRLLAGHPMMLELVLPALRQISPADAIRALRDDLAALAIADRAPWEDLRSRVLTTAEHLPRRLKPLLIPLALHEGVLCLDHLVVMARQVAPELGESALEGFLLHLAAGGLLEESGSGLYGFHPALTGYLRPLVARENPPEERDRWARTFVIVMAALAESFAEGLPGEQAEVFEAYQGSFHCAMNEAERLAMTSARVAFSQALASYLYNLHDLPAAEPVFRQLAEIQAKDYPAGAAAAWHMLGNIARAKGDQDLAASYYRKSTEIDEEISNTPGAAATWQMLGALAMDRRSHREARQWLERALAVYSSADDDRGQSEVFHLLGELARQSGDFSNAEESYKKALAAAESVHEMSVAVRAAMSLGRLALEECRFELAERHFRYAVRSSKESDDLEGCARAAADLAQALERQGKHDAAGRWFHKSLKTFEELDDEQNTAIVFHHLGRIADKSQDVAAAKGFYQKALEINRRWENVSGMAFDYLQLGGFAQDQGDGQEAERCYGEAERGYRELLRLREALGDVTGQAATCRQLGLTAQARRDFATAESWYRRAQDMGGADLDPESVAETQYSFGTLATVRGHYVEACLWMAQSVDGFSQAGNEWRRRLTTASFLFIYWSRASWIDRATLQVLARTESDTR